MRILNLRDGGLPRAARRVDRHTPFGNPFRIGPDGTRREVVRKYAVYLEGRLRVDDRFRRMVESLRDAEALACWCAPEPCHAEALRDWLAGRREGSSAAREEG